MKPVFLLAEAKNELREARSWYDEQRIGLASGAKCGPVGRLGSPQRVPAAFAMKIPLVRGLIERRILVNYRVRPEVLAGMLPPPFQPKLVAGWGMVGICLIRLSQVRPAWLGAGWGLSSENAAHRAAVEWGLPGDRHEGVYVWRRDTNSWLNALAGGRVFPGIHRHATFRVSEGAERYEVGMRSDDGLMEVRVRGRRAEVWPTDSVFASLAEASAFFEAGSVGYSATDEATRFQGLELRCKQWKAEALEMEAVASSYFDDAAAFPAGSIEFDCALLMRGIEHEWQGRQDLCCGHASRQLQACTAG